MSDVITQTKAAAEVLATKAHAIRQLVDAGFTKDSVVKAVVADDLSKLQ